MNGNVDKIVQKIKEYNEGLFKDKSLLDDIVKNYMSLNIKQKESIEYNMYTTYRGNFDVLLCSSQYHESLKWLRKVMNHVRYQNELTDNKFHIITKAIKVFLIEYLETGNKTYLDKVNQEYSYLDVYDNTLKDDEVYKEITPMIESIKNSTICTDVSLVLPLVLCEPQNKINVQFDDVVAEVCYSYHKIDNEFIKSNGFVEKEFDKEASSGYTKWNIKFHNYYSDTIKVYIGSPDILYIDYLICKCVNTVINQYRINNDCYWVKNIYPNMLLFKSIKYKAGETVFRNIPVQNSGTYKIFYTQEKVEYNDIVKNDIPLYKLLLLNSKSFWLSGNFRESVLSLNTALENYIYGIICPYIVEQSKGILSLDFYRCNIPQYESSNLKNYMSKENFTKAVKVGVIKSQDLSIYEIIKILYKYSSNISKKIEIKRFKKLISSIRMNRNDFIHGNLEEIKTSYVDVYQQIKDFESLAKIMTQVKKDDFIKNKDQ
jgi:hypothetical protein